MNLKKGPLDLKSEIMEKGLCSGCGLCAELCPYIKAVGERVAVIHHCGLEEGNCYRVCPRTATDWKEIDTQVFSKPRSDHVLGSHLEVVYARSLQPDAAEKGQYGGVVSALASYLIEKGEVSAAVLTGGPAGEAPRPTVARSREEVMACSGSHYSASPSLKALNKAARESQDRMAVVGRPCQVLALRKMQGLDETPGHTLAGKNVKFIIGLFCFWSLETEIYKLFSQRAGGKEILKIDIPQEYLTLSTESGVVKVPVEDIRPFIRQSCLQCFDPTSEFADVSVGSTENDTGWNTLIIRSPKGKAIVDAAVADGVLEVKAYPEDRLPLLYRAVRNKKLRVLEALKALDGCYLKVAEEYVNGLKEEGVER